MNLKDCVLALDMRQGNSNIVRDKTHHHNDGTIYGAKHSWNVGMIFDGVDDYVLVKHNSSLSFLQTIPFSITVWFRTVKTAGNQILLTKRDASKINYELYIYLNKLYFQRWDNSSNPVIIGNTIVTDGQWHQGVVLLNSTDNKFYLFVDGNQDATPVTDNCAFSSVVISNLKIGTYITQWMQGEIDDLRMYSRALTANEVKKRYYESKLEKEKAL